MIDVSSNIGARFAQNYTAEVLQAATASQPNPAFGFSAPTASSNFNSDDAGKTDVELNNNSTYIAGNDGRPAQYYYFEGDGQDTVSSNGKVEINLFNDEGTIRQDIANSEWAVDGNTVTIAFADGGSISVEIDDADTVSAAYDPHKGSLVIAPSGSAGSDPANTLVELEQA